MYELYPPQAAAASNLLRALPLHRAAVDASMTGCGKSFTASYVAKHVGADAVGVVCPKAVVPMWRHVLSEFGVEPRFVVNYEKLRAGNTGHGKFNLKQWGWHGLPKDTLLIWDEAHRCQGQDSLNARMMAGSKGHFNLILSATLAQDPTEMRACGYLLGLHNWTNFWQWCMRNGCWRAPFGGVEFKKKTAEKYLAALHAYIFPERGVRIRVEDMGDAFPDNFVTAEAYDLGDDGAIAAAYEEMEKELVALALVSGRDAAANALTTQLRGRQKTELLKVPGLVAMANDLLSEGNSVVIFTNFRQTLDALCEKLKGAVSIHGEQSEKARQAAIEAFQADAARVIVVNIAAGGVGVSLHDLHGNFPRVSLVCPSWDPKELRQALGRIHRAGAKSKAVQRLVFAAGSVEENICRAVQKKLRNLDLLTDGDLSPEVGGLSPESVFTLTPEPIENILEKDAETGCAYPEPVLQVGTTRMTLISEATPESPAVTPTLVHAERPHAPLSPSKLKAKAICPGFQNDNDGDKSAADRGSLGHECVEKNTPERCADDPQLRAAVEMCIGYKQSVIRQLGAGAKVYQEIRLDYLDQWGFTDFVGLNADETHAELIDWKFAFSRYAADSPQFWAYCVGIFERWPTVKTIRTSVAHPFLGKIDVETFTRTEHYGKFLLDLRALVARARRNDPKDYNCSAQCSYCGAAGDCPALARAGVAVARRFDASLLPDLPEGTLDGSSITDPTTIAALLRIRPALDKALKSWSKRALDLYFSGTAIPGFELCERGGARSCGNANAVYDIVKDVVPQDQFLSEACEVNLPSLIELVRSAAPARKKQEHENMLLAKLSDADLLNTGEKGRFLRASKN